MRENASLEAGFVFPERRITRNADDQARWLSAAGADPAVWSGVAETTLWGNDGFRGMKIVRQQPNGYVHIEQIMAVTGHVRLGEEIRFRGVTEAVEPVRKGRLVTQRFEVVGPDDAALAVLTHVGLLPDPAAMTARDAKAGAGGRDDLIGLEPIAEQVLTPERVTTFSREVGNLIHFDPSFAQSLGYRAPLAQGLQTMTWMVGALGPVLPLTVRCRFRRPVFWDDAMRLWGEKGPDGRWRRLVTTNDTGRITADLTVA